MPASPVMKTALPSPAAAERQRLSKSPSSSSRPTSGVTGARWRARKRDCGVVARSTRNTRGAFENPLRGMAPRSVHSNWLPRSACVPPDTTTVEGSAISCSRAARFGVSP